MLCDTCEMPRLIPFSCLDWKVHLHCLDWTRAVWNATGTSTIIKPALTSITSAPTSLVPAPTSTSILYSLFNQNNKGMSSYSKSGWEWYKTNRWLWYSGKIYVCILQLCTFTLFSEGYIRQLLMSRYYKVKKMFENILFKY